MQGVVKRSNDPGDMALQDRLEPTASPGHVVVEVRATGICGTDLHIYKGEYRVTPPVIVGHEICGVVAELGAGVDPAWRGARVVAETFFSTCGHCQHCRDGRPNLCAERRSVGTHADGGMAPLVLMPARNLHRVPEWLDDHAASLAEPVACVVNSLWGRELPKIGAGDRVLVVGPGAIGLVAAQVARACGGSVTVRGTPGDRVRLDVAEAMGFAIEVAGGAVEAERFDVAVECSGNGRGIDGAMVALRKGGRLLQMGLVGAEITVGFDAICFKELEVSAGFASTPASWRRAMRLIEERRVDLSRMVSGAGGLSAWRGLFDASLQRSGLKYVIDPRLAG